MKIPQLQRLATAPNKCNDMGDCLQLYVKRAYEYTTQLKLDRCIHLLNLLISQLN
jgi:hypothetical protein